MFYGAFLLLLSVPFMRFPEYISFDWRWVRRVVVFVHEGAALVTIGAFIIHVCVGAMVHGSVSKDWARAHHPLRFHQKTGE